MYKNIITGILLIISYGIFAQEGTTSPYSYYGIGILKFRGTVENRTMGGVGVFSDSIHLNLQNPAAYSNLRLVTLTSSISYLRNKYQTSEKAHSSTTTSLDYFSIGIPLGKFGLGFGILPYSSVGYNFSSEYSDITSQYKGNGGLNKTYLSIGYQVTPEFSIGVDGQYNFGRIENTSISQKENVQYGIRTIDNSKLGGFGFKIGAIYKSMITNNLELTGSASYSPGVNLNSRNTREIATVRTRSGGNQIIDKREIEISDTDFSFPDQYSIGAAISKPRHWGIGLEYANHAWSTINDEKSKNDRAIFKNASSFHFGGYFIPEYNSFTNYYKRITYRAGMRYQQTGLSLDGQDIDELGISFGLGFPIGRMFSNINIGVEFGKRGTKNHGLIQENFFNSFISFSLNDRWFEKRLYN